jgi:choline dehydrogenase-like flavoprotein
LVPDRWDIIVVGAGSAGSTLAGRLATTTKLRVLLIEAGPTDNNPLIRLPKGMVKLLSSTKRTYFYPTEWHSNRQAIGPEVLLRGRGLGGSSTVNGLVYHRGQPEDYEAWSASGLCGWSWPDMLQCFRQIEDNPLPETEWRGQGGPVSLRIASRLPPFSEALISAGRDLGLPAKEDPNLPRQLGIGPIAENIDARGRRVSAAHAFLPPAVRKQSNIRISPETRLDRILFEGRRAVGIVCRRGESQEEFRAEREVIICAGTLETPRLLQISGIGPERYLASLGIPVVIDSPGVGANYRDHFCHFSQWRLRSHAYSENREYVGWRLIRNAVRHYVSGTGPLSSGTIQLAIFPEVLPGSTGRADAEFVFAPFSMTVRPGHERPVMDDQPGCTFNGFPLRGTSEGSVMARSADPNAAPIIRPNYLSTAYDRAVTVGLVRFNKRLMTHPVLKPYVVGELGESAQVHTDEEIIDLVKRTGMSASHSIGTCRMGVASDPLAVLDERLRVRGVSGLRVADCSVMPTQVSANTHGPAMAIGWKLADMIKEETRA